MDFGFYFGYEVVQEPYGAEDSAVYFQEEGHRGLPHPRSSVVGSKLIVEEVPPSPIRADWNVSLLICSVKEAFKRRSFFHAGQRLLEQNICAVGLTSQVNYEIFILTIRPKKLRSSETLLGLRKD